MAIVGATVGTVTNSFCVFVNPNLLVALPFVPLLAMGYGVQFGAYKDADYEEFGTYHKAGTYRLDVVFFGLRYFPLGPIPNEPSAVYEGDCPVDPTNRVPGLWRSQHRDGANP